MSLEFLTELEDKINHLVNMVDNLKREKGELQEEINGKNGRITELEEETGNLHNELNSQKSNSSDCQNQLDTAAEKIRGIIGKLESID